MGREAIVSALALAITFKWIAIGRAVDEPLVWLSAAFKLRDEQIHRASDKQHLDPGV
ncbi:MAG: hypothetical protein PSX79_16545 [bacterium]|nr:hypothetical protein [bacterium]